MNPSLRAPMTALVPLLLIAAGCGAMTGKTTGADPQPLPSVTSSTVTVNSTQFGDVWPFTFDTVTLSCPDGKSLYVQPEGESRKYALNGEASTSADQEAGPILKQNAHLGAVRSFGLTTCKYARATPTASAPS